MSCAQARAHEKNGPWHKGCRAGEGGMVQLQARRGRNEMGELSRGGELQQRTSSAGRRQLSNPAGNAR